MISVKSKLRTALVKAKRLRLVFVFYVDHSHLVTEKICFIKKKNQI